MKTNESGLRFKNPANTRVITFDGEQYLMAIPGVNYIELLNNYLMDTRTAIFTTPVFADGDNKIELCQLTLEREPYHLNAEGFGPAGFLPLLIPLNKTGDTEIITDEDWAKVQGGSLYETTMDEPEPFSFSVPPPAFLHMFDPSAGRVIEIGDTDFGAEIEWFVVNGCLLSAHPLFLCEYEVIMDWLNC